MHDMVPERRRDRSHSRPAASGWRPNLRVPLEGGELVVDPFAATGGAIVLLRIRSGQLATVRSAA
jgi:hypothetical protein